MKKTYSAIALIIGSTFSAQALASPYVSLGYGISNVSQDNAVSFSDGTNLTPDNSDSTFSGLLGYRFDNNFGFELSYNQYDANSSRSKFVSAAQSIVIEDEWDADLKAKQLVVMPVYFYALNDQLRFKCGAGLTYTQYKITGSASREADNQLTDHEISTPHPSISVTSGQKSENHVGAA
ncbi:AcfA family outer membrane beta-barrel protein [Enterovibrio coralii]|uniref:Outer membrane protein beta-barrel domain-containing protein n=1 Tax=Enterovibrio coralii TaxID=294935 RepID=A0A135IA21_9GAMM|nr:AcfA family outer membrane beta-barrel protein [Enterovibrio coralii]KXF82234.1 hypothetical protein ATN88_24045 [Enterovibrio coralii]